MTPDDADEVTDALAAAHRTATPVSPDGFPRIDSLADGYRVQERLIARLSDRRGNPIGYKIGFTNQRVQADLGVAEPGYGRLLADTLARSPATIRLDEYVGLRVEPEIVFRLGSDLSADASRTATRGAISAVVPAVELVDSRTDWRFDAPLAVADNCLDAGIVVGDDAAPNGRSTSTESVTLRVDGEAVASGAGDEVLGDPLAALAWLAETAGGLPAGALVSTGSLTEPLAVEPEETVTAAFASLGAVELRVR
ncbi:2-keto-4-pentenoate hydratase [Halobaculum gomorrense]|uniref:2-oxo-hept-3-ene-1,7-dioate hydratase/2-keto-4-pentenoate hydratase n=1 Tax=Halobaculum gomorrense TaxID=43928 RepID=A0A1M5R736_9EURY|nr:fumarylacetoacetate hydrolase family protein [Halobaculum gomorrense]SHH22187.1 2-oxo-hept-3-ene-1,7-dioate hydratase/2-keto-4-pentenoate hydratase [Halobaculum gomorrense]